MRAIRLAKEHLTVAKGNPITIRKERFYPHPPEVVWVALTDARALAEWL